MRVIRVKQVVIETFSHATEDFSKVKQALLNTIPSDMRNRVRVDVVNVKGHYGNEIGILKLRIKGGESLNVLKNIICSLSSTERNILIATLSSRVNAKASHLHIRLSKQQAYLNRLTLLEGGDVIKVMATIEGAMDVERLRKFLTELIGGCK